MTAIQVGFFSLCSEASDQVGELDWSKVDSSFLDEIEAAEAVLDVEALVQEALDATERVKIG